MNNPFGIWHTLVEIWHFAIVLNCCFLKFIEVVDVWRGANAVCFDVDSTVCIDEGIDELADFCGAGKAVAEWTAR